MDPQDYNGTEKNVLLLSGCIVANKSNNTTHACGDASVEIRMYSMPLYRRLFNIKKNNVLLVKRFL